MSRPVTPRQAAPGGAQLPAPWWRYGYVWLLIAGPAAVVVASVATAWLAMSRPDPVLADDYYRRGLEMSRPVEAQGVQLAPAQQARNHAATPAPRKSVP